MKSLTRNLLLLTAIAVFAYSCNQDDTEDMGAALPEVSVAVTLNGDATTSPVAMQSGDSIGFSISGTAEGGFNTLNVTYSVDGGASEELFTTNRNILQLEAGTQVLPVLNIGTVLGASFVGTTVVFTFEMVDEDNQINTTTVEATVTSPDAKVQTTVIIFAPGDQGFTKTFYSISENTVYTLDEVDNSAQPLSANIDLGYYYGTEANLVSPSIYATWTGLDGIIYGSANDGLPAWGTRNETKFVATSITEVTGITTVADVEVALDGIDFDAATAYIEALAVGDIVAFETENGLKGLIRVIDLLEGFQVGANPNNAEVTGNIELEFILAAAE